LRAVYFLLAMPDIGALLHPDEVYCEEPKTAYDPALKVHLVSKWHTHTMKEFGRFNQRHLGRVIKNILPGLKALHEKEGFVHGNIKPSNILIPTLEEDLAQGKSENVVRGLQAQSAVLGDCMSGMLMHARLHRTSAESEQDKKQFVLARFDCIPPECWEEQNFEERDFSADAYGLGCTMYYALTGLNAVAPKKGETIEQRTEKLMLIFRDTPNEETHREVIEIIARLTADKPIRSTIEELEASPWYRVATGGKVWAVTPEEATRNSTTNGIMPSPVTTLARWIYEHGLASDGLFRVPGEASRVFEIREHFDEDPWWRPPRDAKVGAIASALKDFNTQVTDHQGRKCGLLGGSCATEDVLKRSRIFLEVYKRVQKALNDADYVEDDAELALGSARTEEGKVKILAEILADHLDVSAVYCMFHLDKLIKKASLPQYTKTNQMDYDKFVQYGIFTHDISLIQLVIRRQEEVMVEYRKLLQSRNAARYQAMRDYEGSEVQRLDERSGGDDSAYI